MKRLVARLAAFLASRQGKPPPLPEVSHPMSPPAVVAGDATDARLAANRYVETASSGQISRVTVLSVAMQNAVERMRERPTTPNVAGARVAVKTLRDYLGENSP